MTGYPEIISTVPPLQYKTRVLMKIILQYIIDDTSSSDAASGRGVLSFGNSLVTRYNVICSNPPCLIIFTLYGGACVAAEKTKRVY